jgi:hypothetical protein
MLPGFSHGSPTDDLKWMNFNVTVLAPEDMNSSLLKGLILINWSGQFLQPLSSAKSDHLKKGIEKSSSLVSSYI